MEKKTKYYLMKYKREEVLGEVVEMADGSDFQEWDTIYERTFHGIVNTLEEVERWVEKVYNRDSGRIPYAVEGKEIYFDVKEEETIIKRKATMRED